MFFFHHLQRGGCLYRKKKEADTNLISSRSFLKFSLPIRNLYRGCGKLSIGTIGLLIMQCHIFVVERIEFDHFR